jgi:hypothetical protein
LAGEKPYSENEILMLIRIPRESLPELSKILERSLDDVERKYELLQKSFKRLYKAKAKRYMKIGYGEDDAFEIVAFREEIDIESIREMGESLARLHAART